MTRIELVYKKENDTATHAFVNKFMWNFIILSANFQIWSQIHEILLILLQIRELQ